jgi:hypothetical protein
MQLRTWCLHIWPKCQILVWEADIEPMDVIPRGAPLENSEGLRENTYKSKGMEHGSCSTGKGCVSCNRGTIENRPRRQGLYGHVSCFHFSVVCHSQRQVSSTGVFLTRGEHVMTVMRWGKHTIGNATPNSWVHWKPIWLKVTRVNSTNVLDEGLRIGEIGCRMNSTVKSVKQGVYRK